MATAETNGGVDNAKILHNVENAELFNYQDSTQDVDACARSFSQYSYPWSSIGGSPYFSNYAEQAQVWNAMAMSRVQQTFNTRQHQHLDQIQLEYATSVIEKLKLEQHENDDVFYDQYSPRNDANFDFYHATPTEFDNAPGGICRPSERVKCWGTHPSDSDQSPFQINPTKSLPDLTPDSRHCGLKESELMSSCEISLVRKRKEMQRKEMRQRIDQTLSSVSFNEVPPSIKRHLTFDDSPKHEDQKLDRYNSRSTLSETTLPEAAEHNRHLAEFSVPKWTWNKTLPLGSYDNPVYSRKVFLGGVPWDITAEDLQVAFANFGVVHVEFPNNHHSHGQVRQQTPARQCRQPETAQCFGYVYVIFEDDNRVKEMLQGCSRGEYINSSEYYFKVSSKKVTQKEAQVIPWLLGNSNYLGENCHSQTLNNETTVFVGALHGMLNAEGLARVMNDLFENVCYAGIDTDKYKYPIGSGRVTFTSHTSYMKAVNAAFVEIKTVKFVKKVQIDPYLEEAPCKRCGETVGPYFCRNLECFTYYCHSCWNHHHNQLDASTGVHKPLCRNSKNSLNSNIHTLMVMNPSQVKPH